MSAELYTESTDNSMISSHPKFDFNKILAPLFPNTADLDNNDNLNFVVFNFKVEAICKPLLCS